MDSSTFTQQLVEYSQVEQQIDTNTNLQTLITQGTRVNASAVTTGYLGKNVSITNGNASLTNGTANWTYNLGTAAASTTLSVTNASRPGRLYRPRRDHRGQLNRPSAWNGQDTNGNQLSDGTYKLAVTAADSNGAAITTSVASAGTVSQIDLTGTAPKLVIGDMEVGIGDVSVVSD